VWRRLGSRRAAATHGDPGAMELLADRGPMNTELGTDLTQIPALCIEFRRTLNVQDATGVAGPPSGCNPRGEATSNSRQPFGSIQDLRGGEPVEWFGDTLDNRVSEPDG
jgi:hypothetical protein